MAAEQAALAGIAVDIYEAMPSAGRKLLMAGRGGLNLTHSEPETMFVTRYGARQAQVAAWLEHFGPAAQRVWVETLGVATFVGSSGRVFPRAMKAAPLLRAWLRRLHGQGVRLHTRRRWLGWDDHDRVLVSASEGAAPIACDALLIATGGASWRRLGSDGSALVLLAARGVEVTAWRPSNCGFEIGWSEHFRERAAGRPLKSVALWPACDPSRRVLGECMVTRHGVEGGAVYTLSAILRDAIERDGAATLMVDLLPGRERDRVQTDLARPRGHRSLAEHLRRRVGISGVKAALLRECVPGEVLADPQRLGAAIKALPVVLRAARPLDEAISSAGGVPLEALDRRLMLRGLHGVFCAGELLDWEAPTGGYLLTACLASGRVAGRGVAEWLTQTRRGAGPPER